MLGMSVRLVLFVFTLECVSLGVLRECDAGKGMNEFVFHIFYQCLKLFRCLIYDEANTPFFLINFREII